MSTHTIPTYPEPPWLVALRTRATTAEAKLSAVAALAHAALAKPSTCATRGLVSARAVLGVVEGER